MLTDQIVTAAAIAAWGIFQVLRERRMNARDDAYWKARSTEAEMKEQSSRDALEQASSVCVEGYRAALDLIGRGTAPAGSSRNPLVILPHPAGPASTITPPSAFGEHPQSAADLKAFSEAVEKQGAPVGARVVRDYKLGGIPAHMLRNGN